MIFFMQRKAYLTFIQNKSEPNRPVTPTTHKIHVPAHTCTTTFYIEQELQLNARRRLMKCGL